MAIFGPKPWVNPLGKISSFRLFELLFFISQKGHFPFQNNVKDIFLAFIALKKSSKNGHYWTKTMGSPLWKKVSFSTFQLLFFIAYKGDFSFQNIVKDFFLAYIALKKVQKMAIFGPKRRVNPFGKMSIFRLFEVLVFIPQKGDFPFQNIIKDIFLPFIALKKKLEKWPFLDQNPLEKCQFFVFLNFLFLQPRKAFFCSRIS